MVPCQIPTMSPSNPDIGEWGMPLIGAFAGSGPLDYIMCSYVYLHDSVKNRSPLDITL